MATTRRTVLRKGLLTVVGVFGVRAAGPVLSVPPAGAAPAPSDPSAGATAVSLTFYGHQWRSYAQGKRAGETPVKGDRLVASGDLHAAPDGDKVGEFHAALFSLGAPGQVGPSGAGSLELHTFVLPDGSIIGTGTATPDPDRDDAFAIIGGTGRYTGARGSYVACQRYRELGGDGTAELALHFVTGEV
ncbi:MAG TPA: hypothetical protein VGQ80_12420 [Acidimicrobiia bacterium]|nr:hypothetical protein [Acidimicrobiia bacterium]